VALGRVWRHPLEPAKIRLDEAVCRSHGDAELVRNLPIASTMSMRRFHFLDSLNPVAVLDQRAILKREAEWGLARPVTSSLPTHHPCPGLLVVHATLQCCQAMNQRFRIEQLRLRTEMER